VLETLTAIWSNILSVLDQFPEENVAIIVYVTGTLIALWCWYRLMSRLPNPVGAILWIIVFAILATPTISEGPNSALAPAVFGLIFGILTKEHILIWSNLSLILFVIGVGLLVGFCWSKYSANKTVRSA
jgi:MFS superfamily sulfate permease-like transporter